MCNRYALRKPGWWKKYVYQSEFDEFTELKIVPRFNVAPSQAVFIVKRDDHGRDMPALARWGFVPSWQRGKPQYRPMNARDDKVLFSGMYRKSFDARRCLVPADAFFEWIEVDGAKQPFLFRLPEDEPFAFAGFYDRWTDPDTGETADRMTFCTTTPNKLMRRFHDRMPCMLRTEAAWERWLDPKLNGEDVFDLLLERPAEGELDVYAFSRAMNNSRHESPNNVEPIPFDPPAAS